MGKKRYNAFAPNGRQILGTLERIEGRADAVDGTWRKTNQGLQFDFTGQTEVFWDGQVTAEQNGHKVYLDDEGNEWTEDQLVLKEVRHG